MSHQQSTDPISIVDPARGQATPPSPEEREKFALIDEEISNGRRARGDLEMEWETHRLFMKGEQYVLRSRYSNEVWKLDVSRDRSREKYPSVDNVLRPIGRAVAGKLSRSIPMGMVIPATSDRKDSRAAAVLNTFVEYKFREQKLKVKYKKMCEDLAYAGNSFVEVVWNKTAGRRVAWCEACGYKSYDKHDIGIECPACQMRNEMEAFSATADQLQQWEVAQMQMAQSGDVSQLQGEMPEPPPAIPPKPAPPLAKSFEGDAQVLRHMVTEVVVDPAARDMESARWYCIEKPLHIATIRQMHPNSWFNIESEEGLYVNRTASLNETGRVSTKTEFLKNHAMHRKYVEAPSGEHPEGRIVYMVNGRIVEEAENTLYNELGRLPLFHFKFDNNPEEFYGDSFCSLAISIQKERNDLLGLLRAHRQLTLRPKLLAPHNSVNIASITTTPGEIIGHHPYLGKPQWLEYQPVPDYVYAELNRMHEGIREKGAVTPQEMGASSGESGRFAAILDAQSSETIGPLLVEIHEEWKEVQRALCIVAQLFYTHDRMWAIAGHDQVLSYSWSQANINPGWDMILLEQDSLSKNPAIRIQQVSQLWDRNLLINRSTGMPDPKQFMRLAGVNLPSEGPDFEAMEHAYGQAIPEFIQLGKFEGLKPWDDVAILAEELAGWLKGDGRTHEDKQLVYNVAMVWMQCTSLMMPTVMDTNSMPNASAQQFFQQPQKAPRGGPGGSPVTNEPTVAGEAAQGVQAADQQAESITQASVSHEN